MTRPIATIKPNWLLNDFKIEVSLSILDRVAGSERYAIDAIIKAEDKSLTEMPADVPDHFRRIFVIPDKQMEQFTKEHPPSSYIEEAVDNVVSDVYDYWNSECNLVDFKILLNNLI